MNKLFSDLDLIIKVIILILIFFNPRNGPTENILLAEILGQSEKTFSATLLALHFTIVDGWVTRSLSQSFELASRLASLFDLI